MVRFFRHVSYTDSASEMSRFEEIRKRHSPRTAASLRDIPAPEARQGSVAWAASPRGVKVPEGWDQVGSSSRMQGFHLHTDSQRARSSPILSRGLV